MLNQAHSGFFQGFATEFKRYLGLERRENPRHGSSVEVRFCVWDAKDKKALTKKVGGRLANISSKGACLQAKEIFVQGHHLMRDNDLEGQTPLVLELPPFSENNPWAIHAQVIWYNKDQEEGNFHFDVGLKFVDLLATDQQKLEALMKSVSAS
jgi:hypothetical protein